MRETIPHYDADGNLVSFGAWSYTYDAASQLVSVSSNGVLLVTNQYDCRRRRVKKITPNATYMFLYDDWNLIHERVDYTNGMIDEFNYYWGCDLSGTLQGAGGVGGLLYVKRNGVIYVPHADANGNILRYTDTAGNVVAAYTYNAFGRAILQSGPLADVFRHRFSTKYFDMETGLYYYGRRFYSPVLRRWSNRDPIGEEGGNNLYCFCGNNSVLYHDVHGCAYFAYRPLDVPLIGRSLGIRGNNRHNDRDNTVFAHEQLIFEDTGAIINIGYGAHGKIVNENIAGYVHIERSGRYNDCLMRRAVDNVKPPPYSMLGWFSSTGKYNCQDYADDLRKEYDRLMMDPCARKRCGLR